MTLFATGLIAFVLLVILTAIIGGVLDLPSLAPYRCKLAERKVRLLSLVVAAAPAIAAALDLPGKVAALSKLPLGVTGGVSLIGGAFFTAALAGCWLAMDEARDPHSRPKPAIISACVLLIIDALVLRYFRILR